MKKEQPARRSMAPPQPAVSLYDSKAAAEARGKARARSGDSVTAYESDERPGYWGFRIEPPAEAKAKLDPPAETRAAATRETSAKKGGEA